LSKLKENRVSKKSDRNIVESGIKHNKTKLNLKNPKQYIYMMCHIQSSNLDI